jgi:hypothetical protein
VGQTRSRGSASGCGHFFSRRICPTGGEYFQPHG